jgi:hypothetical protein
MIEIDDHGVRRRLADGTVEQVAWDDLVEVSVLTTSNRSLGEDVFFRLEAGDGRGCVIPRGAPESGAFLERLQRLPGFDNKALIQAMGSIVEARSICWRRGPNDGGLHDRHGLALSTSGTSWRHHATFVLAGLAILVALFVCGASATTRLWIGTRSKVLTVQVADEQTGQAIPNASVRLFYTQDASNESKGRTDANGEVQIKHQFTASGEDSCCGLQQSGSIRFWDTSVAVQAEGYEPMQMPLHEVLGRTGWDLHGPPLPPVLIPLRKK